MKIERVIEILQELAVSEYERGKADGAADMMAKIKSLTGEPVKVRKPRGPNKPKVK